MPLKEDLYNTALHDIAVAESIIEKAAKGRKKIHEPTIENFRGQLMAWEKVLAILNYYKIKRRLFWFTIGLLVILFIMVIFL